MKTLSQVPDSAVHTLAKEKLFNDLKVILGSLPVRLPESAVIELARAAWREAVVEDVQGS